MKILITGAAGFIGFHLSQLLLGKGHEIIGLDNLNSYYDPRLKEDRLAILREIEGFSFYRLNLHDKAPLDELFSSTRPDYVVNLAAQAGVRYSIENPYAYLDSNLVGFMNILEACRRFPVKHLIFASSSSVYGGNRNIPFSSEHSVDHPVSLYAATKKSNELMAHAYSHLYKIPSTGLRFFTVYGPWGRPDMAYFSFTKAILEGKAIKVFNHGNMERDFTYIADVVQAIESLLDRPPLPIEGWNETDFSLSASFAPYKIYNIGNNQPVRLIDFIQEIEKGLGIKAEKVFMDMQPGDVPCTYADITELERDTGYRPATGIDKGIPTFLKWYREYYHI